MQDDKDRAYNRNYIYILQYLVNEHTNNTSIKVYKCRELFLKRQLLHIPNIPI